MDNPRELRSERFLIKQSHADVNHLFNINELGIESRFGHMRHGIVYDVGSRNASELRELADLIDRWNAGEGES